METKSPELEKVLVDTPGLLGYPPFLKYLARDGSGYTWLSKPCSGKCACAGFFFGAVEI
jgi:hypothetical protein